ncbi:LacI family DNA-binding transcriptional regulator [Lacticaseibacillus saniviri]
MPKVTISTIADAAGVSKATVSRYLNGHFERMSSETKQKIAAVIKQFDYYPNRQASSLKSSRTHLIGVVAADISNIYSTLLIKGINEVARTDHNQIMIGDAGDRLEQEREVLQLLLSQNVDGIILQPQSADPTAYQFITAANTPMVMVDRLTQPLSWPTVTSTDYRSSFELAQHVVAKYNEIAVFSNPIQLASPRSLRYQAFVDAAAEKGAHVTLVETTGTRMAPLADYWRTHKEQHPAIFSTNGRLLMAVLQWLQDNAIQYPKQVGICGYDDWDWASLAGPGISSVAQHPTAIGAVAMHQLMAQIDGETLPALDQQVPATVNIRHSL